MNGERTKQASRMWNIKKITELFGSELSFSLSPHNKISTEASLTISGFGGRRKSTDVGATRFYLEIS